MRCSNYSLLYLRIRPSTFDIFNIQRVLCRLSLAVSRDEKSSTAVYIVEKLCDKTKTFADSSTTDTLMGKQWKLPSANSNAINLLVLSFIFDAISVVISLAASHSSCWIEIGHLSWWWFEKCVSLFDANTHNEWMLTLARPKFLFRENEMRIQTNKQHFYFLGMRRFSYGFFSWNNFRFIGKSTIPIKLTFSNM